MKTVIVNQPDGEHFYMERMKPNEVEFAVSLCDEAVGKNLYPLSYLKAILEKPNHFFLFLRSPEGKTAGYFYFYTESLQECSDYLKLSLQEVKKMVGNETSVIANMRSIGVLNDYRGQGLATAIMDWAMNYLRAHTQADIAIGVCWKPKGRIVINNTMEALQYHYFKDLPHFWYDVPDLVCPYCKGRCQCDAALYYKPLKGGQET